MPFKTILRKEPSALWGCFIDVPAAIAESLIKGTNRRVKCTINGTHTFQCAVMPNKGKYFINIGKPIRTKFKLEEGQELEVSLVKDTSQYGFDLPEEFEAVLDQDMEFKTHFHKLTPGKQRSLIYLVLKIESSEKRINKALAIAEHLNEQSGALDYKLLNVKFKEFNNRY